MTQVIKKPNSRITYYVNEEKGVVIAKLKKWDMVTDTNLYLLNHYLVHLLFLIMHCCIRLQLH